MYIRTIIEQCKSSMLDMATCLVLVLKATSALLVKLLLLSLFLGLDEWHYFDVSILVVLVT